MPAYSATVLDHFQNPRNLGAVEFPDAVAEVENPACGDRARLSLRIESGRITEARFLAEGCPAAIAAASMTTVLLTGATLERARALRDVDVAAALDGLPPNKVHCSVLAEDVIREALDAYVPPAAAPEVGSGPRASLPAGEAGPGPRASLPAGDAGPGPRASLPAGEEGPTSP